MIVKHAYILFLLFGIIVQASENNNPLILDRLKKISVSKELVEFFEEQAKNILQDNEVNWEYVYASPHYVPHHSSEYRTHVTRFLLETCKCLNALAIQELSQAQALVIKRLKSLYAADSQGKRIIDLFHKVDDRRQIWFAEYALPPLESLCAMECFVLFALAKSWSRHGQYSLDGIPVLFDVQDKDLLTITLPSINWQKRDIHVRFDTNYGIDLK